MSLDNAKRRATFSAMTERTLMLLVIKSGVSLATVRKWSKGGKIHSSLERSILDAKTDIDKNGEDKEAANV